MNQRSLALACLSACISIGALGGCSDDSISCKNAGQIVAGMRNLPPLSASDGPNPLSQNEEDKLIAQLETECKTEKWTAKFKRCLVDEGNAGKLGRREIEAYCRGKY